MGRTGRKRAGNIIVTLMKDKEEHNFAKAKDNYEKMQKMIASGSRFEFHDELSPRIVPKTIRAEVVETKIEIPIENTQASLPEPKKRAKPPKRPPKKFHMPDGVRTGFTSASRIDGEVNDFSDLSDEEPDCLISLQRSPTPEPIPTLDSVVLKPSEEKLLEKRYLNIGSNRGPQIIPQAPRLDAFPHLQRLLRPTKRVKHGTATKRTIALLQSMHEMRFECPARYLDNLHPKDREEGERQRQKRQRFLNGMHVPITEDDEMHFGSPLRSFRPDPNVKRTRKPSSHSASSLSRNLLPSSPAPDDEEEDEDDNGSDLADFIDDTILDPEAGTPVSSASSPPIVVNSPKSTFYEPVDLVLEDGSQALGEELPDFETLLEVTSTKKRVAKVGACDDDKSSRASVGMEKAKRRRGRRAVVESDSDGDDHG